MARECPNGCGRSFRNGGGGLVFHLTWCQLAEPVAADPIDAAISAAAIAEHWSEFHPGQTPEPAEPYSIAEPTRPDPIPAARPILVRPVRRGPADAECDMVAGPGFILPRASVPGAFELCNSCDERPMVTDGSDNGAGYCAECLAQSPVTPEEVAYAQRATADPTAEIRPVRRGPADEAVDMWRGPGWILPRADAERMGLISAEPIAERATTAEPKARKVAEPKAPSIPKVGTGKHSRCVVHERIARTAPGVAFACFDVAPDAAAIVDRRAFMADVDTSWLTHHDAFMAAAQTGDGLADVRVFDGASDKVGHIERRPFRGEPGMAAKARKAGLRSGYSHVAEYASRFVPYDREKHAREVLHARGPALLLRFAWARGTTVGIDAAAAIADEARNAAEKAAAAAESADKAA